MHQLEPRKILIIDNSSWNVYNFRLPLVKALVEVGFKVYVATPIDEFIHYLNSTHFTKHIPIKNLDRNGKNPLYDLLFWLELMRMVRREKPDLVINFTIKPNIYGSLAARIYGLPAISVATGLGYTFLHPNGFMRLVPFMYKFAFKRLSKLVLYNHEDFREFIERKLVGQNQCEVILGDGIDMAHFRPIPQATEDIEKQPFVFLFIGRLLKDKGVVEYVEAAKRLIQQGCKIECWILGDLNFGNPADILKEQLVEWIDQKYVRYLGTSHDVRPIIAKAHALVLPSYREGMPRVILEAMSMGKPIITTKVAGCDETVVEGHNGYKVPPKDADALFAAMSRMQQMNRYRLMAMGENSRIITHEKFRKEVILEKYISLITSTLGLKQDYQIKRNETIID